MRLGKSLCNGMLIMILYNNQLKIYLTPYSTALLAEPQIVPHLVNKYPPICGTEGTHVHNCLPLIILSQINPVHALPSY